MRYKRPIWEAFKVGRRVQDTWYRDCGIGTIMKRGKRTLLINFPGTWGEITYDRPHATGFLEIVK